VGGVLEIVVSTTDFSRYPACCNQSVDLRFALRTLRRSPGFTILAVLMMALGIGANTAMFSVVNAVMMRPLEYRDAERIVVLSSKWENYAGPNKLLSQVAEPDVNDFHDQSTMFDAMSYYDTRERSVMAGDAAAYARVTIVSPEFFRVFQVQPFAGRMFSAEETTRGSAGAALISESYWRTNFAGRADAIGRTIRMFGKSASIVGVMPAGFRFPEQTDIWIPIDTVQADGSKEIRQALNYQAIARLKPGVSVEQAQAQLASISERLARAYPNSNKGRVAVIARLRDDMVREVRLTMYLLLGAVGVVLLIACANMATLLLAKASGRSREIAIRAAVGASRLRIVRQLITESLLLAMVSGSAGLMLAWWASGALVALAPGDVPRLGETAIDGWVLAFTLATSVLASLVFGLAPALQASRVDLNEALKQGARAGMGGATGRLRGALVVAEIAMCVVLLAGAGLLLKSFMALHDVALGFRPDHLLVMKTTTSGGDFATSNAFFKGLLDDISTMPGVTAAGATMGPPGHVESTGAYWIDHMPKIIDMSGTPDLSSVVAPGTFAALGTPIVEGRDFNDGDSLKAPQVGIVNEAVVRTSFHGEDPIGRTIFCPYDSFDGMKIVGVVGDVRQYGPAHDPSPECFMPYTQHRYNGATLSVLIRTAGDPRAMVEALRRKVRERSADVSVDFTTMVTSLAGNIAPYSFRMVLIGMFAGLAVMLAMAGIYGVMAYVTSQRAGEMGLRMALGASQGSVLRLVLRQGLTLAVIGLAIGLAGALAATRVLSSVLFGVKANDPWTYVGVAILIGVVTTGASLAPAVRASRVDPLTALRQE
jgi:putative ABC transport system permease protein